MLGVNIYVKRKDRFKMMNMFCKNSNDDPKRLLSRSYESFRNIVKLLVSAIATDTSCMTDDENDGSIVVVYSHFDSFS